MVSRRILLSMRAPHKTSNVINKLNAILENLESGLGGIDSGSAGALKQKQHDAAQRRPDGADDNDKKRGLLRRIVGV